MAQTAVCTRLHSIEQQWFRWLLMRLDRLPGNKVHMPHEWIADMLGVRRERVTEAAGDLRRDGLVGYQRGSMIALDRPRLEQRVCECHAVVTGE